MLNNFVRKSGAMMWKNKNEAFAGQVSSLNEYFLVASPEGELAEKINDEREHFISHFPGISRRAELESGLLLARFLAKDEMEETLSRWIKNICALQSGLMLRLNNFGGVPAHTVFLRIQDATPLSNLKSSLRMLDGFLEANHCPPVSLADRSFIPVAEGIPLPVYDEAISFFASRSFGEAFVVDKLFLLKRTDLYENCKLHDTFTLPRHPANCL